jgi:Family of unknown function (DUF6029)
MLLLRRATLLAGLALTCQQVAKAQEAPSPLNEITIHGDFQTDVQTYKEDLLIGAPRVPEHIRSNTFGNIIMTSGRFSAGARYEAYLAPLQGFDSRYKGQGFPYRFATYSADRLQVTVGNFYEQFGSGLIFRAYEERNLGIDNSLDGLRVRLMPYRGVRLTGMMGRQRFFFDKSPTIVRGGDVEVSLNDLLPGLDSVGTRVTIGGSFVSKYQVDDDAALNLPENVGAGSGRVSLTNGGLALNAEYAQKINDPSLSNGYIYRPGRTALASATWSGHNLGLLVAAKRVDNFDFRVDRNTTGNYGTLNFLPALTRQHTYALAATIYPYATQPLGEMAAQAEVSYHVPKGTIGGRYGTDITVNYSAVNGIAKDSLNDEGTTRQGYSSGFFKMGSVTYYRDLNIELHRRFSPSWKLNAMYVHLTYNKDVVQGLTGYGIIDADIVIVDVLHKFSTKHSLRAEAQTLQTKQDQGSWVMGLLEYTYSPHWFATIYDQYNYGNHYEDQRIHYVGGQAGYVGGTTRIALGYGRQRAGIVCVGGVCRFVPASNGASISITSSF